MLWIKQVEMVDSVDDLKSSRSIQGEDSFCFEQDHPEFLLQGKGQSGGTESSKRTSVPSRKTDRLHDLRLLLGYWRS